MQLSRLRRGEIIAFLSALALALLVFVVPWIQFSNPGGGHTSANAWTSLPTLRWQSSRVRATLHTRIQQHGAIACTFPAD